MLYEVITNPAKSLPRGTLAAIATGYIVYMALPLFIDAKVKNLDLLRVDYNIMQSIARWGWLIVAGVFAASLSSALGSRITSYNVCYTKLLRKRSSHGE